MDERLGQMINTAADRKPSSFLECEEEKSLYFSFVNNVNLSKSFCLGVMLLLSHL